MSDIVKFGGTYSLNIDIAFEARKAYTQQDVDESKQEFEENFCKQIEEWLKAGVEDLLDDDQFKVRVEMKSNYFEIDKGGKDNG